MHSLLGGLRPLLLKVREFQDPSGPIVSMPMHMHVATIELEIKILKFFLLGWRINAGNSPAVVLAIVWFLLLILTLFLPRDIAENSEENQRSIVNMDSDHEINASKSGGTIAVCPDSNVFCLYYLIFLNLKFFYLILFPFMFPYCQSTTWDWDFVK